MLQRSRLHLVLLFLFLMLVVPSHGQSATLTTHVNVALDLHLTAPDTAVEPLTFVIDALPTNGRLVGQAPQLMYIPYNGYIGPDSLTYSIIDTNGTIATTTIDILVVEDESTDNPPPEAEEAIDVTPVFQTDVENALNLSLASGTDYRILAEPSYGTVSGQVPDLVYVPDDGFEGTDILMYAVTRDGTEHEVTMYIQVGEPITVTTSSFAPAPSVDLPGVSHTLSLIVQAQTRPELLDNPNTILAHALDNLHGDRVEVTIRTAGDPDMVRARVESLGGTVTHVLETYILGEIPLSSVATLGADPLIANVDVPIPVIPAQDGSSEVIPQVGNINSQGLTFTNANAWHANQIRGQGVRIGVTDIGFDNLNPTETPCVKAVLFSPGVPYVDNGTRGSHGSAVLEVICDMAPYAEVYAYHLEDSNDFANAVDYFANGLGISVFNASVAAAYAPGDGTGVFSQTVNGVTYGNDVVFAIAAGNYNIGHYEGWFTPMPLLTDSGTITAHDFNTGVVQDAFNILGSGTLSQGTVVSKQLIWDDWNPSVTTNFDLQLYREVAPNNWDLVVDSNINNVATDEPRDYIEYTIPNGAGGTYALVIQEVVSSGRPVWLQLTQYGRYQTSTEFENNLSSVSEPGAARSAFSVAAALVSNGSIAYYSGHGPANGDGVNGPTNPYGTPPGFFHPLITGPTNVATSIFGVFDGTSASTPHAAGAAALVRQAYPYYTRTDTQNFLLNRAQNSPVNSDPGDLGADTTYGYGYLWLGNAPSEPTCEPDTVAIYRDFDFSWYQRYSNSSGFASNVFGYGLPSDRAVVGDWNGDGVDTVGIFRNAVFYLKNSNASGVADITFGFGAATDIPIAGDWNGDGIDTIGLYRPSTATWYLRNSNSSGPADIAFAYGLSNETPVTGDWDGDGIDTIGIFRASDNSWYLRNSNSAGYANQLATFGLPATDTPITGDWNGDCVDTIGLYRRASATWFLKNRNSNGVADISFTYGLANETPVTGKWVN